jgi:hypothetical protein
LKGKLYPVKSTQIFSGCSSDFFLIYKYDTQPFSVCLPEKNLGRSYRVDFTGYPSNQFSGYRLNGRVTNIMANLSALFLSSIILDAKHEKIIWNNQDFCFISIRNVLPTLVCMLSDINKEKNPGCFQQFFHVQHPR